MKKLKLLILFMICTLLIGCAKEEKTPIYTELTQRDAGEPYSDWGNSTTGSVKYLDGTTVLVTIYLDDVNSQWLESDEQLVADNMKVACDYLKEQGELYGKDVNIIYDTSVDGDLTYRLSYKEAFGGSTRVKAKGDKADQLVYSVYDYIENSIDAEAILKKYNANSIGYMVFIDGEADKCTAYCYHLKYKDYYYREFCLISLRWSDGTNVYPDTYAHEILHLFGAKDLYYTSEYGGMSKEFIDYVYEEYPTDIMLGFSADVTAYSDNITSDVSKITAYFLGWNGYITELEEFPYIKTNYIGSFSKSQNTKGANFLEYSLEPRKLRDGYYDNDKEAWYMDDNKISVLISLVIAILMLISMIFQGKKMKNKNNISLENDGTDDI